MSPLFKQLCQQRQDAVRRGEKLLYWFLNHAALDTLAMDESIRASEGLRPIEDRPLLGLPIVVDEKNRSDEPSIILRSSQPTDLSKLFPASA